MCSCCTGMKAKNVLARTCPELRYQHLGHLVWEAEKRFIQPPSARVVNIKLFIQTGTAQTEETEEEKLSNRLVVRSHIWNMQTKFLMQDKKTFVLPSQGWVSFSLRLQGRCSLVVARNSSWSWEASSQWTCCPTSCAGVRRPCGALQRPLPERT